MWIVEKYDHNHLRDARIVTAALNWSRYKETTPPGRALSPPPPLAQLKHVVVVVVTSRVYYVGYGIMTEQSGLEGR